MYFISSVRHKFCLSVLELFSYDEISNLNLNKSEMYYNDTL